MDRLQAKPDLTDSHSQSAEARIQNFKKANRESLGQVTIEHINELYPNLVVWVYLISIIKNDKLLCQKVFLKWVNDDYLGDLYEEIPTVRKKAKLTYIEAPYIWEIKVTVN